MLQDGKCVTIKVLYKKGRTEWDNYRGISLFLHAVQAIFTIEANWLVSSYEDVPIFSEKQCDFRRQRPPIDMMLAVRRLQELGLASIVPLSMCFIDLQMAVIP